MRETILDISDAKNIFDKILAHWSQSNEALCGREIILRGNFGRNSFLNCAVEFDHMSEQIEQTLETRDKASAQLALYKENMRRAMQRFSFLVRGLYPDQDFTKRIPALPDVRSNEDKFMDPVDRTLLIWKQVNSIQQLVLPDGTTLEAFALGVEVLRQAFGARDKSFEQERFLRASRRRHHGQMIDRAVQYRQVVLGMFGEESEIAQALPYLWPKQDRKKKAKADEAKNDLKLVEPTIGEIATGSAMLA